MDAQLEFARALVRPVVTLSGWAVLLVMYYTGTDVPDKFFNLQSGVTLWYFADRTVKHIVEHKNGKQ